jgi:hypothetical protein
MNMKTIKLSMAVIVSVMTILSFSSCDAEDALQSVNVEQTNSSRPMKAAAVQSYCGTPLSVDLIAGQNTVSGSIVVANDGENLYVTYETSGDWSIKQTQLYVGSSTGIPVNKGGNPTIGQFPFKSAHTPNVTSYTYTIALSSLPECFTIAAHAEVLRKDALGNVVQTETGWGKGQRIGGNSWAMKFDYCVQACEEPEEDTENCFSYDTAWADGSSYVSQGSWATFSTFAPNSVVTLYAGQTKVAGTVSLSSVDVNGNVTITVTFASDWSQQEVSESVKIQGYDSAPSGNPAIGNFTTYKGNDLTVTVPYYPFYGIHLDVRKSVSCE